MGCSGANVRFKLFASLALAILPAEWFAPALLGQPESALTTVQQVRKLSPDQARAEAPVRLDGIVTVLSTYKNSFFFRDSTGGVSVDRSTDATEIHPGDRVEIVGVTGPGQFAPVVEAQMVKVKGKQPLGPPRLYEFNEIAGGRADSQWIALRGLVRSAAVQTVWGRQVLVLNFDMGVGSLIPVHIHDYPQSGWERLPGSIVEIRGVAGTVFNDRRQFMGVRVFISSLKDVTVEQAAPADPFDIPLQSFDDLLLFSGAGESIQRTRLRGIATYTQPGQGLYLQQGQRGVFVRSRQKTPIALGSDIEAIGYLSPGRYSPTLDDAAFRIAGKPGAVAPIAANAAAMVVVNADGFSNAPYDSSLVRLQGRLIHESKSLLEDELVLEDGGTVFSASLPASGSKLPGLGPGSLLLLTGVCVAHVDESHEARDFEILLRSPADLVILERAPWWNLEHVGWLVSAFLLLALLAVGFRALRQHDLQLRAMAMTDSLTGLYNRRGFLLLAGKNWQQAARKGSILLLFYLDVDLFKEINDTLGHEAGDRALQSVAEILRGCFRGSDVIARLGGDEFAVACDASVESPALIETRLASAIDRLNQREDCEYHLSLSVGVLVCDAPLAHLTFQELMVRADALMYEKKRERQARREAAPASGR